MLANRLQERLAKLKTEYLLRHRHIISDKNEQTIVIDGKPLIHFCSNDYLNISQHEKVKKAFIKSIEQHGLGSGASAQISGYTASHAALEEAFADFLKRDCAVLFNSGYHANLGVLTTFANRETTVIADKYCHASLIDGVVLSRAKLYRYRHNDIAHASDLLQQYSAKQTLLLTESLFSMQGDLADLTTLSHLAKKKDALLIVDDAHGIGVLGEEGRGISEHLHLSPQQIPCLITPFGKAIGSFGAIVSGDTSLIEALLQDARTYRYSTSLPPAICDATRAALQVIQHESWRRKKLNELIQFFTKEALDRELILYSQEVTPIKSVLVGTNQAALFIQQKLLEQGFFVSCIRPPTIPKHESCIRISLNCFHNENQISTLLDLLKIYYDQSIA